MNKHKFISLCIALISTLILTIILILVNYGFRIELVENNFLIRFIEILMGLYTSYWLLKIIKEEILK